jgi:hypothetical protein
MKGVSELIFSKIQKTNPENIKIPSIVKAELLSGAVKSLKIENCFQQ